MRVTVCQAVHPSDGSRVLPEGEYEVSELRYISRGGGRGLATFVIAEGPEASATRRIGVVLLKSTDGAWGDP